MPLVVLHGLGRSAAEWTDVAHAIDADAIVPDLAEMRQDDRKPSTATMLDVIAAALAARGVTHAAWLGHSAGAHLALEIAQHPPALVERLVLVSAVIPRARLQAIACPVLIVMGANDAGPDPGTYLGLSHVRVERLSGARHDPHRDAPDALVASVRGFLAEREP